MVQPDAGHQLGQVQLTAHEPAAVLLLPALYQCSAVKKSAVLHGSATAAAAMVHTVLRSQLLSQPCGAPVERVKKLHCLLVGPPSYTADLDYQQLSAQERLLAPNLNYVASHHPVLVECKVPCVDALHAAADNRVSVHWGSPASTL
jgi:hypothetical protein